MRLRTASYVIGFLGFLLVLVAGTALDLITTRMLHGFLESQGARRTTVVAEKLKLQLRDTTRYSTFWALTRNPEFLVHRSQSRAEVLDSYRQLATAETAVLNKELIAESERDAQALFLAQDQVPILRGGKLPFGTVRSLSNLLQQASAPLDRFTDLKEARARDFDQRNQHLERVADWIARVAELISALLLVGIIWFLRTYLSVPIQRLARAIVSFKEGDRHARAPAAQMRVAEIRGAAGAFNDLADRLNDLEQQRLQYLAGTVHDLRNPLTVLKTSTMILRSPDGRELAQRSERLLQIIDEQVDRLSRQVSDLIDRQQVQSGRLHLSCQDVDLVIFVEPIVRTWQVASRGHVLVFNPPPAPLPVYCDADRIQQAINNLLSNAIKYSPEGGPIQIKIDEQDGFGRISVTDKGIGVAPEDRERIFEPFRRSVRVRDQIPGTGLGLSSTRKIVEAHGGRIEVESQVGVGSTFRIYIPRKRPARKAA